MNIPRQYCKKASKTDYAQFTVNLIHIKNKHKLILIFLTYILHTPKINNVERQKCEDLLTEYECSNALKAMKNCKSPRSDGITTEFYKILWNDIFL